MSQEFEAGQRLGDYEILGVLGAGGMGKVYKVRNTISDRVEAMKILLPNLAGQKDLADRFLREIKLLASLNHPNIAALRTALTLDNQLVMIMEFVDGVTLSSRLQKGPIPPGEAVKYIDQVLDALSYAHKQNIIHRDIKPANMMITPQGVVKLMDFGIARSGNDRSITMTGTTLGSLNYMPPEQVKGEPADARSDLYSLGVSLYEMVTGQLPFAADSNYALMAAHLQEPPKPPIVLRPGIPQPLNQIILMALAKEPAQRFQSANAFRAALKSVPIQGVPTQPDISARSPIPSATPAGGSATALFQGNPPSPATLLDSPSYAPTQPFGAAAPADIPPPPSAVATRSGHRGLYIGLGAFIVVGVLFGAGLYLPRHAKTQAGGEKTSSSSIPQTAADSSASSTSPAAGAANAQSSTSTPSSNSSAAVATNATQASPSSQSASDTPPTSSAPSAPAGDATTTPASGPDSRTRINSSRSAKKKSSPGAKQSASQSSVGGENAQAAAADAALAEEAEHQLDQLQSRSTSVTHSLDGLKRQQAAQGYGLRGDIVAAEERMKTYISKAEYFMQRQDAKSAKKYLDMAEPEIEKLEKFLGH